MSIQLDESEDSDIPEQAVRALSEAHRRSVLAGHAQVLVQNGQLLRIENGTVTVLKQLPPRKKTTIRTKFVKS